MSEDILSAVIEEEEVEIPEPVVEVPYNEKVRQQLVLNGDLNAQNLFDIKANDIHVNYGSDGESYKDQSKVYNGDFPRYETPEALLKQLEQAEQFLLDHRVILLVTENKDKRTYQNALYSLLHRFRQKDFQLRFCDKYVPLQQFYSDMTIYHYDNPTVTYVDASVAGLNELINLIKHENVQKAGDALSESNNCLVFSVKANALRAAKEEAIGLSEVYEWQPSLPEEICVNVKDKDTLIFNPEDLIVSLIQFTATFFQELDRDSFLFLINAQIAHWDCLQKNSSDNIQLPTYSEAWKNREDYYIDHAGVKFQQVNLSGRGYAFTKDSSQQNIRSQILEKFPNFAARCQDALKNFYFNQIVPNKKFVETYAEFLIDLNQFQIIRLDVAWLFKAFEKVKLVDTREYNGLDNLTWLLIVFWGNESTKNLVAEFFTNMLDSCVQKQGDWQALFQRDEKLREVCKLLKSPRMDKINNAIANHKDMRAFLELMDQIHGFHYLMRGTLGYTGEGYSLLVNIIDTHEKLGKSKKDFAEDFYYPIYAISIKRWLNYIYYESEGYSSYLMLIAQLIKSDNDTKQKVLDLLARNFLYTSVKALADNISHGFEHAPAPVRLLQRNELTATDAKQVAKVFCYALRQYCADSLEQFRVSENHPFIRELADAYGLLALSIGSKLKSSGRDDRHIAGERLRHLMELHVFALSKELTTRELSVVYKYLSKSTTGLMKAFNKHKKDWKNESYVARYYEVLSIRCYKAAFLSLKPGSNKGD